MDRRRKVLSPQQLRALDEAREAKQRVDSCRADFEQAVIRAYQKHGCGLADFPTHNVGITGPGVKKILDRHGIPTRKRGRQAGQ